MLVVGRIIAGFAIGVASTTVYVVSCVHVIIQILCSLPQAYVPG
jgi:hypothetical protein